MQDQTNQKYIKPVVKLLVKSAKESVLETIFFYEKIVICHTVYRSGCKPYIMLGWTYLYSFSVKNERFHGEVNADSGSLFFNESATFESLHDAGFADAHITDDDDLEEIVEGIVRFH